MDLYRIKEKDGTWKIGVWRIVAETASGVLSMRKINSECFVICHKKDIKKIPVRSC